MYAYVVELEKRSLFPIYFCGMKEEYNSLVA